MGSKSAKLRVEIESDASGVDRGLRQADSRFGALSGKLSKLSGPAGLALGAIATAAAGVAVASVKAASDVQQSMGAVETVFGKAADQVKAYSDKAAVSVGLSKSAYAQLAAGVGISLSSMGKSQSETAKSTDALIARAADLAATFGGTTQEAVEALGSAFRGEFDPAEKFGIQLKQSDINARLAAKGQDKLQGAALKAATTQASYALIMEKSQIASGSFRRETNTLAHQQQVLGAQFENVKAKLGAKLLPVITSVLTFINNRFLPGARRLGDFLRSRLSGDTQKVSGVLDGVRNAFRYVSDAIERNRDNYAKLRPVLVAIGKAIAFLAPIVGGQIKRNFENTGRAIQIVIDVIGFLIGAVDSAIRRLNDLAGRVGAVVGDIRDKVEGVGNLIGKLPGFSVEVTHGVAHLTGDPGFGDAYGGLLTASFGDDPFAYSLGLLSGRTSGGRRSNDGPAEVNITIQGAVDPIATARQIERLLRDNGLRTGRVPSFGIA